MMADPLSVIAGVVGVGATVSKGVSIFSDLVDAVQNAPDEFAGMSRELCGRRSIVSSLQTVMQNGCKSRG